MVAISNAKAKRRARVDVCAHKFEFENVLFPQLARSLIDMRRPTARKLLLFAVVVVLVWFIGPLLLQVRTSAVAL